MKKYLFLASVLFFALPQFVFADAASIGGYGNTAWILDNNEIQMISETILIDVHQSMEGLIVDDENAYLTTYGGFIEVQVDYVFKNTTPKEVTVKMGFPEKCGEMADYQCMESMEDNETGYNPGYKLNDFQALDSGTFFDITFRNDIQAATLGTNWYIFDVSFAPHEEKQISNTYWVSNSYYRSGMRWFYYILETGASWKGGIEEVNIIVNFEDNLSVYDVSEVNPAGYQFNVADDTLTWHFTNLEPTSDHNIEIHYRDPSEVDFECEVADENMGYGLGEASSYLPSEKNGAFNYYPCQAYDYSDSSMWVEGVSGSGIGEWVKIPLDSNKIYEKVKILSGFVDGQESWGANNRIKTAKITFSNGMEETFNLEDSVSNQFFNLSNTVQRVDWAKLEIVDVYKGSRYDDTCLTEVRFMGLVGPKVEVELVFPDVAGHRYQEAVEYVKEEGIVEGYPDGYYRPDNTINRAELTKIVIEAVYPGQAAGSNCFPDVNDEWFAKYVCFAKDQGIISGYPDGYFRPGNDVNYVEALKITFEAFGLDVPEIGIEWWNKYMIYAEEYGLTIPDMKTAGDLLKRGQMAELIMKVMTM